MDFEHHSIEDKWKKHWKEQSIYKVSNNSDKPKFYILDMFPYPSGAGLHVGHPLGYIASDIVARYKRMSGFNVLHPMGFDAFGLPAEQYAIQTGIHPADSTKTNIERYRKQLDNIGLNYDWDREVQTHDPEYYKWTQWIFLNLFEHYYDLGTDKATPVSQLVNAFETGGSTSVSAHHSYENEFSAEEWKGFSKKEQEDILMEYRLAYRSVGYVNWCEALGTVLANDEVKDGVSERGGHPVEKRAMMQWCLRITAYAERLLSSLDKLDWSDSLKTMQRNWIGKSVGAQVFFNIEGSEDQIEIFTTRPDTIFGATYMVLAPEHDLVNQICSEDQKTNIEQYKQEVASKSEIERLSETKEVTGAFTGAYAVHPFSGDKLPIWISEYVLKDYGTGAIMAVPSEDQRDRRFAEKFALNIVEVVDKSDFPNAEIGDKKGKMINSEMLNGLEILPAIAQINSILEEKNIGKKRINYKLRDANFSRQRYWGEPFPISFDAEGIPYPMTEDQLPLELPDLEDFKPSQGGKSPLANVEKWVNHNDGLIRETDTMPGYAGSSWYYLRYMDPSNKTEFASKEALDYWQDVDLYVGGTEHAVGHLMYSRFWNKFLFDMGKVSSNEPFKKLINQGMIQGVIEYVYLLKEKTDGYNKFMCSGLVEGLDESLFAKIPIYVDFVQDYGQSHSYLNKESIEKFIEWRPEYKDAIFECSKGTFHQGKFTSKGETADSRLTTVSEVGKMSKRYFNVVNPDDIIAKYGADTFRMYEMFLGPIEQSKPWDTKGIEGVAKFLRKFWRLYINEEGALITTDGEASKECYKILHQTIKKVKHDIDQFSFNTAVSAFMIAVNELKKLDCKENAILLPLCKLLAPFAPFMTEELFQKMGHGDSIHMGDFPNFDEKYLVQDEIQYPLCVNGKKRALASFPNGTSKDELERSALENEEIKKWTEGHQVVKVIVVPNRMINIVIK